MLRLLVLVLLTATGISAQPAGRDSIPVLPDFSVPVTGDYAPPQTSPVRAFLYSAAATAVPVAVGALLIDSFEPSGEPGGFSLGDAGVVLVISGVWFGPLTGNLSLGAGEDARRAFLYTSVGFLSGVALGGAAFVVAGGCLLDDIRRGDLGSGDTCADGPVVVGLLVTAAAAAAVGTVAGTAYSLGTIPRNAARAQRYREAYPRVTVAPGWQSGRPALAVRVGL